jgi:hypothetical protein
MPVDPDSLSAAPSPMSRPPYVIRVAHVITRTASIIGPIANLDRDGAWSGGIARGTGITGSVWAITRVTGSVWAITRVTGSVCRRTSIIISASAYAHYDWKEKEQESRSFRFGFRFHIVVYGCIRTRQSVHASVSVFPNLRRFIGKPSPLLFFLGRLIQFSCAVNQDRRSQCDDEETE